MNITHIIIPVAAVVAVLFATYWLTREDRIWYGNLTLVEVEEAEFVWLHFRNGHTYLWSNGRWIGRGGLVKGCLSLNLDWVLERASLEGWRNK